MIMITKIGELLSCMENFNKILTINYIITEGGLIKDINIRNRLLKKYNMEKHLFHYLKNTKN